MHCRHHRWGEGRAVVATVLALLASGAAAPMSAHAEVPNKVERPVYAETSQGVTVTIDRDPYWEKSEDQLVTFYVDVTVSIEESAIGEELHVNLSPAFEALDRATEQYGQEEWTFQGGIVPSDSAVINLHLQNNSRVPYRYSNGSLVLGNDEFIPSDGATGTPLTAFDGHTVYVNLTGGGYKNCVYRQFNVVLGELCGVDPNDSFNIRDKANCVNNKDGCIDRALEQAGCATLSEYYVKYYNEHLAEYGGTEQIGTLADAPIAYLEVLFGSTSSEFPEGSFPASDARESEDDLALAGYRLLYSSLLTVNGAPLAEYMARGDAYGRINGDYVNSALVAPGECVELAPLTYVFEGRANNAYQNHAIPLNASFSLARSYDAKLYKHDSADANKALAGAEFDLYADEVCTKKVNAASIVTDENGFAVLLEDAVAGTYWLKETKAPEGYDLRVDAIKVELGAASDVDGDGVVVVELANTLAPAPKPDPMPETPKDGGVKSEEALPATSDSASMAVACAVMAAAAVFGFAIVAFRHSN